MRKRMNKTEKLLSDREAMLYRGLKSSGIEIAKTEICKETVRAVLGMKETMILPDGTVVNPSLMEQVVVSTVMDAIDRPSTTKLKDLANINGELKTTIDMDAKLRTGKDLFEDIANEEETEEKSK